MNIATLGTVFSIILAIIVFAAGMTYKMSAMLGLAVAMVICWLDGSIPMGVVGLFPLVLLPIFGITSAGDVSESYFSDGIVICWGSLIMAQAIEDYQLHEYFAKKLLKSVHSYGNNGILFGFIFLTGFLSMWLSNTATAALMTPLSKAVQMELQRKSGRLSVFERNQLTTTASAVDLSIAFAATLGGMTTVTGTGANIALTGIMNESFEGIGAVSFFNWMLMFLPLGIINLLVLWVVMWAYIKLTKQYVFGEESNSNSTTEDEIKPNGPQTHQLASDTEEETAKTLSYPEKCVLYTFLLMAVLWMTRDPPGGWGWSKIFTKPDFISDGTVAVGCSLILLVLPKTPIRWIRNLKLRLWLLLNPQQVGFDYNSVHQNVELDSDALLLSRQPTSKDSVLSWKVIARLNWDIIFLLGGGFALSKGFQDSGLSEWLTDRIVNKDLSLNAIIVISCIAACFATNVMSNVAVANIILPTIACIAPEMGKHPLCLLAPVTLATSLALLFPIGTPPNAIVLANGHTSVKEMAFLGAVLTVIILSMILLYCIFAVPLMLPTLDKHSASDYLNACDS